MSTVSYTAQRGAWQWPESIQNLMPFRNGVRRGDLVIVGGQAAFDRKGEIIGANDHLRQVEVVMGYIADVIADLAGDTAHLAKLTVFYEYGGAELEIALMRKVRAAIRSSPPPAVSFIPLPRLAIPGLAVLIDALAVVPSGAEATAAALKGHWRWPEGAEFSYGLRCGKWTFVSGQMASAPSGETLFPGEIVGQARATIDNVSRVLASLGCDLDDVVKLNTWYTGDGTDADWRKAAEIRANAFRFPGPGATGVPVPGPYPNELLLRQECMALRSVSGDRLPRALSWPLGHWDWPIPVSFQQALKIGDVVVLGGQIATDTECKAVFPGDMRAQTRNVMESIQSLLAGFELGMDSIAKLTCFYRTRGSSADLMDMISACGEFLPDPAPPITIVPLENLGFEDVTLEIEGLAFGGS
ncbi:MAG: Enamine deaminase RidA [Bryobacterales bacterium]|nr:Enamine deaminase RidA [Bryobacterales bacterium]